MNDMTIATTDTRINDYKGGSAADLNAFLQSQTGISRLAVGKKFESDDLVSADCVKLCDFEWVSYVENAGTPNEKEVSFALWAVEVANDDGTGKYDIERGYYQGGTILNKIANVLMKNPTALADFQKFGVRIKAAWGKTSGGNKILLIDIV